MIRRPPRSTLFPYRRSSDLSAQRQSVITLNVVARTFALILGAVTVFMPGGVALGVYFALQCIALILLLVRLPHEYAQ